MMTDELTIEVPESPKMDVEPLGEVLLAARNAKNLTQKDVSDNLRLSIKQIDALETNVFNLLPEAMITRGFIRNYARFLDVDAEPLLESYRARVPDKSPNKLNVQSSINQAMLTKESQPWLKYILASILVLLSILSWFFYMDYIPKPAKKTVALKADEAVPVTIPLPEIALPAAERMPEVNDVVVGADAATMPNLAADASVPVAVAPNVVAVATPPVAVDFNALKASAERAKQATSVVTMPLPAVQSTAVQSKAPQLSASQDSKAAIDATAINTTKKVSMSFTEKTWVSVTNKSGKVIFEKMLSANSTDGFDGEPPFNVLIGNAKATKLMYLGKPVDLASSTKNNVAHITLQ